MSLKVDFAALDAGSGDIRTAARNLRGSVADMDSGIKKMQGQWDGEAKAAYQAAQEKWNSAMEDINQLLEEVGGAVDQARAEYHAAEQRNIARNGA